MAVDVFSDGHDELFEVLTDSSPEPVLGEVAEEAFHHVEPRSRGGREADVESLVFAQPALHSLMLVGGVVVADQVDVFACGYGPVDHAQEPQPLLMTVLLLA